MGYSVVENFKSGVDRSRPVYALDNGTLWQGINGHISRGGDFEQRKKFAVAYNLPAGLTFGFFTLNEVLHTFGSGVDPGVPAGVTYQRLQHPNSLAMTAILSVDAFSGFIYAIAKYSDNSIHHFYNGITPPIITDWTDGVVRSDMTNNTGIATHLKDLIHAHPDYNATSSGAVITVTAAVAGTPYQITATAENGGTNTDQTSTVSAVTANVAAITGVKAKAEPFKITGGTAAAGNQVTSVKVNGVAITTAAVLWTTSNANTATLLAANINAFTGTSGYTATSLGESVTVAANVADIAANDLSVEIAAAGNLTARINGIAAVAEVLSSAKFSVVSGSVSPGVNKLTTIKINGVEVLGVAVDYLTLSYTGGRFGRVELSQIKTAAAIAAQIVKNISTVDYTATSSGAEVTISAIPGTGIAPNDFPVFIEVAGDIVVSTQRGIMSGGVALVAQVAEQNALASTIKGKMSGGVATISGTAQVSSVTIGGTFDAGDKFSVNINDVKFGAEAMPSGKGTIAKTHKRKMYSPVGSVLNFSGLDTAIGWNRDDDAGAGFIHFSDQSGGSENITGIGEYQNSLALFSRRKTQLWSMANDDADNLPTQTLSSGTVAQNSIVPYGQTDTFYLSDSGIRSLRARDVVNTASVADVGTPIDNYVIDYMATLSDAVIAAASAVIEPVDSRYLLALGTKVFVFSYFPFSKISAWTWYELDISISAWGVSGRRLYARAGDAIYLYGGANNDEYDTNEVVCWLPFFYARKEGTYKMLCGLDQAAFGTWQAKIYVDPNDLNSYVNIGELTGFTFNKPDAFVDAHVTHMSVKLTRSVASAASISKVGMHYLGAESETG